MGAKSIEHEALVIEYDVSNTMCKEEDRLDKGHL